jgi:AcrR family transcriptional regulator
LARAEEELVPRSAAETRSHVLEVASDLFYSKGIRATGVDKVAAEAGVAPTTLYRLFPSKDDLVAAYVDRAHRDVEQAAIEAMAAVAPDPRAQILALLDTIAAQIDDGYRGCAMQMALAEFPDPDVLAHRNAVEGKAWVRERFGELTGQLDVDDPVVLADHLSLIVDGMLAVAQSLGRDGPAKNARRLAEAVLPKA